MNLVLAPTQPSDLKDLYLFQEDPHSRWMAAFMPSGVINLDSYIERWTRFLSDPSIVHRVIYLDGILVGSVGKYEMEGEAELTYWVQRKYWGRGIATAACLLFLQEMTVRPLNARAAIDNAASIRVLEKLGFHRTGTDRGFSSVREAEIDEVIMVLKV